ncbi:MAG TPA: hypothetical protein VLA49_14490 [Anaerolineales bacterium]|nr:hypothetical protein [Anaerolineales bacterium]
MKLKFPLSVAIVIAVGLIVLLGYFIELPTLVTARQVLLQWAVALAAVALLVGVVNLLSVHYRKAAGRQKGGSYSLLLIASLLITLAIGGFWGPKSAWSLWIFNNIQVPVESSLMGLLAVILVFASARLLWRRLNLFSLIFLATALVMLLGAAPILGIEIPGLHGPEGLRALIVQIPAVAGARGILLGIGLGTIATGLRVLIGTDRPYGG